MCRISREAPIPIECSCEAPVRANAPIADLPRLGTNRVSFPAFCGEPEIEGGDCGAE